MEKLFKLIDNAIEDNKEIYVMHVDDKDFWKFVGASCYIENIGETCDIYIHCCFDLQNILRELTCKYKEHVFVIKYDDEAYDFYIYGFKEVKK